jgi:hypothetical protein
VVCLRGASAVQEILDAHRDLRVHVFVVWEPVIATDLAPPTTGTLARIHDRRADQYWDHDRALSAEIVRSVLTDPDRYGIEDRLEEGSIVWDTVALFAPQVRWEGEFPVPAYYGYPVVNAARGLGDALGRGRGPGSDPSRP